MRAAARRIVVLFGSAIVAVSVVSAGIGLAVGASLERSVATGLYLVGCFLLVLGVFAGIRGPLRPAGSEDEREVEPIGSLLGIGIFSKGVRRATGEERSDAHATAWLFLALGLAMIFVGMAIDPRTRIF